MHEEDEKRLRISEIPRPRGVTLPPGRAAEVLGVSESELKKRASEWGIKTYWYGRYRRYLLRELEDAKKGLLDPEEPSLVILDFGSIEKYDIPESFGFGVHGKGVRQSRYLGRYSGAPYVVKEQLQAEHGSGRYTLRLIDSGGNFTKYKFSLVIDGPSMADDRAEEALEFPEETPIKTKMLWERLVNAVRVTLQSVR